MERRRAPTVIRAVEELERARTANGTVLTIGTFDGVHRGHQYVVGKTVEAARALGLKAVVVTFRAPPRSVLRPETPVPSLSSLDERVRFLEELGVDMVVPLTFDLELAQLHAREFVGLLRQHLGLRRLVIGPDFALGNRREGTAHVLTELGGEMGFTVEALAPFQDDGGARISSSAIRQALAEGDVQVAQRMLGRPYRVTGPVVRGYQRGKEMGFPTANISVSGERAVPADGVYVTRVHLEGVTYPSVTNVGDNPTFGNVERSVETFILDFDRSIYGVEVSLEFLQRLRGEVRFPNADALAAQIREDVEQARAYFR
jgi:riboflavin kinase/FMN adenylyltransferase